MESNNILSSKVVDLLVILHGMGNAPKTILQLQKIKLGHYKDVVELAIGKGFLEQYGETAEPMCIPTYNLTLRGKEVAEEAIRKRNKKV